MKYLTLIFIAFLFYSIKRRFCFKTFMPCHTYFDDTKIVKRSVKLYFQLLSQLKRFCFSWKWNRKRMNPCMHFHSTHGFLWILINLTKTPSFRPPFFSFCRQEAEKCTYFFVQNQNKSSQMVIYTIKVGLHCNMKSY